MDEAYERLRIAIVWTAVRDYKTALKKRNYHRIRKLERWFKSEWGEMLCGGKGQYIIEQCRKGTPMNTRQGWY